MTTKTDLAGWLEMARQKLSAVADQPSIEAQALLAGAAGQSRAWIFAHSDQVLSSNEYEKLDQWLSRRLAGEPLPYILGRWEFYGLDFCVTPAVLIPRPETEQLVDLGRDWLQAHPGRRQAADVGTGSGCIAAALAAWTPDLNIAAVDTSAEALEVARGNLARLGLAERVHLLRNNLLDDLVGPFDLICANLPYIPTTTLSELEVARYEPQLALDGGVDGLRLIEPLLEQAVTRLAPGGRILLEIEISQGQSALLLAMRIFPQAQVELKYDLSGLPRIVVIDN
jgi:release factor glutamine methyltransferase